MKKLFALLMIVLYGLSSTGATVQLHYCCGKLKSIELGTKPVKDCGSKHKMGSKPCCETKALSAKSQDQQKEVYTVTPGQKAPAEPQPFYTVPKPLLPVVTIGAKQSDYSPPQPAGSLCILHCVFRI